jgi:ribulose-bisphosphate carboxylase large chain
MAHPGGVKAGVQSIQEAWEAAVQGVPLKDYAESRTALKTALGAFGG